MWKQFYNFWADFLIKEKKNKRKVSACFFEIIVILNIVQEAVSEFLFSFSSLQLVDLCLCFSAIGWISLVYVS